MSGLNGIINSKIGKRVGDNLKTSVNGTVKNSIINFIYEEKKENSYKEIIVIYDVKLLWIT